MISFLNLLPPLAAFISIFVLLFNRSAHPVDLRVLLLRAVLLWCAYFVLAAEVLSLFQLITLPGLLIAWLLPVIFVFSWFFYRARTNRVIRLPYFKAVPGAPASTPRRSAYRQLIIEWVPLLSFPTSWFGWLALALLGIVLGVTFFLAWYAPPFPWDAFTYHLSRVAHWASNRSIHHYATGIERQNSMGIAAELLILNTYVLLGSDRLANLVQWSAMVGSLVGVSLAAKRLGAGAPGQWAAAVFAAALPMGLAQASNSANDYVTSFWLVCAAAEILEYQSARSIQASSASPLFFAALAASLAVLTKATAVPFLIPFALYLGALLLVRQGIKSAVRWGAVSVGVFLLLNAGYLGRNWITYGHLSNPADFEMHANELKTLPGMVSLTLKHAGMHAGLPWMERWNQEIDLAILKVHILLGLDVVDPRTTVVGVFRVSPPSRGEDIATNPYHAYLILAAFLLLPLLVKRVGWTTLAFAALLAASFLLFSFIYKWQIFSSRLQLPFFVLFSPIIGMVLDVVRPRLLAAAGMAALFVLTLPWLISLEQRPLFSRDEKNFSVLSASRQQLYFDWRKEEYQTFKQFVGQIEETGCSRVALMLWGDDPEYLFWDFLGAPRSNLEMEWIVAGTPSARYRNDDFSPCAVLCRNCAPEQQSVRGLPLKNEVFEIQLFARP